MEIEITPELLADLKEKAEKAINYKSPLDGILPKTSLEIINLGIYSLILALIAKIEELQKQLRCLEAWKEYDQDMMARDSAFKYELKVLLSLMKNSDPPVDDHKRMIEAVRELVANAKTNP